MKNQKPPKCSVLEDCHKIMKTLEDNWGNGAQNGKGHSPGDVATIRTHASPLWAAPLGLPKPPPMEQVSWSTSTVVPVPRYPVPREGAVRGIHGASCS